MEGPGKPRLYSPPYNRPTSPPATPGTQPQPRFPSTAHIESRGYNKRMGIAMFAHSPPLEHIEPTGEGHRFKYTRPQSADLSSRPSSASGFGHIPSREPSRERSISSDKGRKVTTCTVEDADFILEELGTESEYNSETEILRPDRLEEANSEAAAEERLEADTNIIGTFRKLNCVDSSDSEDEQTRRYRQKKKRWSAGIFKRSHSQSIGSDSDMDDTEALDAHDVGSSARRLRRRVRGPGDRSSLIFEEHHVIEVEEPEDDSSLKGPPSLPSDVEDFGLEHLPFWVLEDPMEIESDSSRPPSRA